MNNSAKKANRLPIVWKETIPLALFYCSALAVFWTGISWPAIALCLSLYVIRMWAVTAGYHRYFSHRSFKTSRFFQFILAFLAQTSMEQGVLWWANHHRQHHKYSDTPRDFHSPKQHGFWYSHIAWFYTQPLVSRDYTMVSDLEKFPELVFLDKFHIIPAAVLAVICYCLLGWQGVVVGFVISTLLVHHGSYVINSLTHVFGKQRYITGDDSRNHWFFALITLGEGWHNNHHFYPSSTRQGFFWWEIDITYYVLQLLACFGLVWDLRQPPKDLITNKRHLSSHAAKLSMEMITAQLGLDYLKQYCQQLANNAAELSQEKTHQILHKLATELDSLEQKTQQLPPALAEQTHAKLDELAQSCKALISNQKLKSAELRDAYYQFLSRLRHQINCGFLMAREPNNELS